MKTLCINCRTVLTDETGRREPAVFDSSLPNPGALAVTAIWARCEPCYAVAAQRRYEREQQGDQG